MKTLIYAIAFALITVSAGAQTTFNPPIIATLPGVSGSPRTVTPAVVGSGTTAISSITASCGASCTLSATAPSGTNVGTITITTSAGQFGGVPKLVASGGSCSGGDITRFQLAFVSGNYQLQSSSNPPTAGSYHVCVQAVQTFTTNTPQYAQINITVS